MAVSNFGTGYDEKLSELCREIVEKFTPQPIWVVLRIELVEFPFDQSGQLYPLARFTVEEEEVTYLGRTIPGRLLEAYLNHISIINMVNAYDLKLYLRGTDCKIHMETRTMVEVDLTCLLGYQLTKVFYSHIHLLEELIVRNVDEVYVCTVKRRAEKKQVGHPFKRYYFIDKINNVALRANPHLPIFVKYDFMTEDLDGEVWCHFAPRPPTMGKVEIIELSKKIEIQNLTII